jgi:hypothetical protein
MNSKIRFVNDDSVVSSDIVTLKIEDNEIELELNKLDKTNDFEILKIFLSNDNSGEEREIIRVLNLLSKEQKNLCFEFVLKKTLQLTKRVKEQEIDIADLRHRVEAFEKNLSKLEQKDLVGTNARITNIENKYQKFDQKFDINSNELAQKIRDEIRLLNINTLNPASNTYQVDTELIKIKKTLNIMIELWEKGTDFSTVLLKAKSAGQFYIQSSCSNTPSVINLSNYKLDYSNDGSYIGNGPKSSNIFEPFNNC